MYCRLHSALLLALASTANAQDLFQELHRTFPWSPHHPASAATADFDGDSNLDIVTISIEAGSHLRYLKGDGTGAYRDASASRFPSTVSDGHTLRHGDVDHDGDEDLLVIRGGPSLLLLNDGSGHFIDVSATHLAPDVTTSIDVLLGDVNGDGLTDLIWLKTGTGGQQNRLSIGIGFGRFQDATGQLPTIADATLCGSFGDLDGDSDLDLFIGNGNRNQLYENDGTGHFTDVTATNLALHLAATWVSRLVDVDGDSDLDLFTVDSDGPQLYENDGTGVLALVTTTKIPLLSTSVSSGDLADVDGDGDVDALLGGQGTNPALLQPVLLLNDGTGRFLNVTGTPLRDDHHSMGEIQLVDLDGDADLDALIASPFVALRSYRNRDSYPRYPGESDDVPALVTGVTDIAFGDLNGDGSVDALWSNGASEESMLGDFTGRFRRYAPVGANPRPGFWPVLVRLGDFDGDGDLDGWIVTTEAGTQPELLANNGRGTLNPVPYTLPAWPASSRILELAVSDIDGDADLDVITLGTGTLGVYVNDGTGHFTIRVVASFDLFIEGDMALTDMDGDLDVDIVVGRDAGTGLLFRNDGQGNFTNVAPLGRPFVVDTNAVAAVDLDGDGDDDLVGATSNGRNIRIWTNRGNLQFFEGSTMFPVLDDVVLEILAFDHEGDGDQDLYFATLDAPDRLFLNDGNGSFVDASTLIPADVGHPSSAHAVDVDHDGDPDVVLTGAELGEQVRVLRNTTRQVAYTSTPRVGRELALEVMGEPGSPYVLAVSGGAGNLQLGSLGTFRLFLPAVVLFPGANLDAFGRGRVRMVVPNDASFIDLPIHWQAFTSRPIGFTNLEISVLQGF